MELSRLSLTTLENLSDLIVNHSEFEKDGKTYHPRWYSVVDPCA